MKPPLLLVLTITVLLSGLMLLASMFDGLSYASGPVQLPLSSSPAPFAPTVVISPAPFITPAPLATPSEPPLPTGTSTTQTALPISPGRPTQSTTIPFPGATVTASRPAATRIGSQPTASHLIRATAESATPVQTGAMSSGTTTGSTPTSTNENTNHTGTTEAPKASEPPRVILRLVEGGLGIALAGFAIWRLIGRWGKIG